MHIDHSKLVELLVETSGIEKEKIENQLADLVEEINEAIDEGEAYEVEGFGVFSAIGNNVVFIPSDELATEINYKYVGMEAIEMDEAVGTADEPDAQDQDDPFAGLLDDEPKDTSTPKSDIIDESEPKSEGDAAKEQDDMDGDSPFGFEDEDQPGTEEKDLEEKPGPDKWGIDTYKDESDENMFSGLLGDTPKEESEQEEEHFKAVFDHEEDGDEDLERISEIERELSGEADSDKGSKIDEEDEDDIDPFASLAGLDEGDNSEEEKNLDRALESSISDDKDEDDLEEALSSSISEKDDEDDIEPVPVIKNITSGKPGKEEEPKTEDKKKDKKRKPFKRPQKAKGPGSQSAILLIIIIIIVLGSGIYGLGYFGFVNIPGITPAEIPATTQTTPPAPNPQVTEPLQESTESGEQSPSETTTDETSPTEQIISETEQESETQVSETQEIQEQAPAGETSYGLRGTLNESANDGYTIVVYSLTNEDNARAKVSELSEQGYRVILASIPHQQYGTLWRVSLGQFETMRDAALAGQDLGDPFTDNYFITQIQ
ncbi:SPOR domain-containing protein [Gracilimonas sp. Q87]|uniref:SPOR domain-containing protein n=1 Tax=Gracilimonas sp. Q87 TaxID=3384766 RepID=UPI00398426DB